MYARSLKEVTKDEPIFEFEDYLKLILKIDNSGINPKLVLSTGGDMVAGNEVYQYTCMLKDPQECLKFKSLLFNGSFAKNVMPFEEGNFFDQPSVVR